MAIHLRPTAFGFNLVNLKSLQLTAIGKDEFGLAQTALFQIPTLLTRPVIRETALDRSIALSR